MNDKENLKVAVIKSCVNGTITVKIVAERLNFSERDIKELKARSKKYIRLVIFNFSTKNYFSFF